MTKSSEPPYRIKTTIILTEDGQIDIAYDNPGDVSIEETVQALSHAIYMMMKESLDGEEEAQEV